MWLFEPCRNRSRTANARLRSTLVLWGAVLRSVVAAWMAGRRAMILLQCVRRRDANRRARLRVMVTAPPAEPGWLVRDVE